MGEVVHGSLACGWCVGDTFVCIRCKRTCCYCFGCDDPCKYLFECCDDCWGELTETGGKTRYKENGENVTLQGGGENVSNFEWVRISGAEGRPAIGDLVRIIASGEVAEVHGRCCEDVTECTLLSLGPDVEDYIDIGQLEKLQHPAVGDRIWYSHVGGHGPEWRRAEVNKVTYNEDNGVLIDLNYEGVLGSVACVDVIAGTAVGCWLKEKPCIKEADEELCWCTHSENHHNGGGCPDCPDCEEFALDRKDSQGILWSVMCTCGHRNALHGDCTDTCHACNCKAFTEVKNEELLTMASAPDCLCGHEHNLHLMTKPQACSESHCFCRAWTPGNASTAWDKYYDLKAICASCGEPWGNHSALGGFVRIGNDDCKGFVPLYDQALICESCQMFWWRHEKYYPHPFHEGGCSGFVTTIFNSTPDSTEIIDTGTKDQEKNMSGGNGGAIELGSNETERKKKMEEIGLVEKLIGDPKKDAEAGLRMTVAHQFLKWTTTPILGFIERFSTRGKGFWARRRVKDTMKTVEEVISSDLGQAFYSYVMAGALVITPLPWWNLESRIKFATLLRQYAQFKGQTKIVEMFTEDLRAQFFQFVSGNPMLAKVIDIDAKEVKKETEPATASAN